MPFSRRLPRLAPTARVTVRLTPPQRDLLLAAPHLPRDLGHALHRATVRAGKLQVGVNRAELETMIRSVAAAPIADRAADRNLRALLDYLESLEDRFVEDRDPEAG
jgi:hypothetical protein